MVTHGWPLERPSPIQPCAEGVRQADAVARIIPDLVGDQPARVITSSLRRTQMTGAAVAAALGSEQWAALALAGRDRARSTTCRAS